MDYKTVLVSVAASVATVAVSVPLAVNYVTLQAASPGTPDAGHINVTGNVIAGRVGVNDTPGLARVQIKETGGIQALRAISGTGVAVYGQSNATTGLGAGGYFTSASAGGRAVVGEQMSASGNTVGGLFFTHSPNGVGVWGRHNQSTGTSAGVYGETLSTNPSANGVLGQVSSTSPASFSSGVRGINNGTGGSGIGVYGSQSGSGWGTYGYTPAGIGVYGASASGMGVVATSTSGTAGYFSSDAGPSVRLALNDTTAIRAKGDIQRDYGSSSYNCVPIAYGWIQPDGSITQGTGNFTCVRQSAGVYEITLNSTTFSYLNGDLALTTALSIDLVRIQTSSVGGKIRIYTFDNADSFHDEQFAFAAFVQSTGTLGPKLPDTGKLDDTVWAKKHPKEAAQYMAARNRALAEHQAAMRTPLLTQPSPASNP